MISVNLGEVKIKGSKEIVMAETATLIHCLAKAMDKETIMMVVNDGLLSDEELEAKHKKYAEKFGVGLDELLDSITEMCSRLKDGKRE